MTPAARATLLALVSVAAVFGQTNAYSQMNLVSDVAGMALKTDSRLVNPWGLSRPAAQSAKEAHWWASDQVTGLSTLYDANGSIVPLAVTIPAASGAGAGSPTGTNVVGANFVFATLDGTISEWISATQPVPPGFDHRFAGETCTGCHVTYAVIKVNNNAAGASYTGSTTATVNGAQAVFVANSHGAVEEYDSQFNRVSLAAGAFTDPRIPSGYTPYGIQAIGKKIYVTYASLTASGGYVDAYTSAGALQMRLQNGAWFSAPWGVALAPADFGAFSGDLLVGQTGSGAIAAFAPATGRFLGYLDDSSGQALAIPGLWSIYFGAGNTDSGPVNTLYFNAGIDNFTHGLFGAIAAN